MAVRNVAALPVANTFPVQSEAALFDWVITRAVTRSTGVGISDEGFNTRSLMAQWVRHLLPTTSPFIP